MEIYEKDLDFFSKYLSVWVAACIVAGTALGFFFPRFADSLAQLEFANISIPIAVVLLMMMMYPIMLKVRLSEIIKIRKNVKPITYTVIINWAIKPFTMALIAWVFMHFLFSSFIPEALQNEYIMGMIILGLAPCTAMTLVWTYLARANLSCALIQVTINDLIILALFAPTGILLLGLTTGFHVPLDTLFLSVLLYVALPLVSAAATRKIAITKKGEKWLEKKFIPRVERLRG